MQKPSLKETPLYLGYLLTAYQNIYQNIYTSVEETFSPEFLEINSFYQGNYTFKEIFNLMPNTPQELLTESYFVEIMQNPKSNLIKALKENDRFQWKPNTPVNFVFASGDFSVPPDNSRIAFKTMKSLGAKASIIDVGSEYDHGSGFIPSILATKHFFEEITNTEE